MLKNFAFGKPPVRHRQDHHRVGTGVLCVLRTPRRLRGRQVGNAVHAGTVELEYGDQTVRLGPGDSAYFDASISHNFRSVGTAAAEVVVVADNDPNGYRR